MSDELTTRQERVLAKIGKDVLCGDDGYYIYWPLGARGALSSHDLRLIASVLDERNEAWDQQIRDYFQEKDDAKKAAQASD